MSQNLIDVMRRYSKTGTLMPGFNFEEARTVFQRENIMDVQEAATMLKDFIADNGNRYLDYQNEEFVEAVNVLQQAAQAPVRKTRYLWAVQNGTKTRFFTTGKMSLRRVQEKFAQKYGEAYQDNLTVKFIEEV